MTVDKDELCRSLIRTVLTAEEKPGPDATEEDMRQHRIRSFQCVEALCVAAGRIMGMTSERNVKKLMDTIDQTEKFTRMRIANMKKN